MYIYYQSYSLELQLHLYSLVKSKHAEELSVQAKKIESLQAEYNKLDKYRKDDRESYLISNEQNNQALAELNQAIENKTEEIANLKTTIVLLTNDSINSFRFLYFFLNA